MNRRTRQLKLFWHRFRKNRLAVVGLIIFLILVLLSILAPVISPYGLDEQVATDIRMKPCAAHWFGTDNFGRDILTRVLYGGRISLSIGLVSTAISAFFGIILGSIAGYFGGKVDSIIMRILDIFMALPTIIMAIAVATILGTGTFKTMLALGIATLPKFARIVRSAVLPVRNQEYIEAAVAIDLSTPAIIFKHILPNAIGPVIVQATLYMAMGIMAAASLSFVGLGVQPPAAEWGAMITAGRAFFRADWQMITFPGLFILLTVFSMNVFGDGLRDALDPRLKD